MFKAAVLEMFGQVYEHYNGFQVKYELIRSRTRVSKVCNQKVVPIPLPTKFKLRNGVRGFINQGELRVEPLLLCFEYSQPMWFGEVMLPGCLSSKVFQLHPTKRRPGANPKLSIKGYVSLLA